MTPKNRKSVKKNVKEKRTMKVSTARKMRAGNMKKKHEKRESLHIAMRAWWLQHETRQKNAHLSY